MVTNSKWFCSFLTVILDSAILTTIWVFQRDTNPAHLTQWSTRRLAYCIRSFEFKTSQKPKFTELIPSKFCADSEKYVRVDHNAKICKHWLSLEAFVGVVQVKCHYPCPIKWLLKSLEVILKHTGALLHSRSMSPSNALYIERLYSFPNRLNVGETKFD